MLNKSITNKNIGELIKRQRSALLLTASKVAKEAGLSQSHLGRIERGERFPSAGTLRKIAKPLGFAEEELFMLAGFFSDKRSSEEPQRYNPGLDASVAAALAQEPVHVQRSVIGILSILKSLNKANQGGETPV